MKKITAHSNFLGLIVIVSAVLCLSPLTSAALQGDLNGDNAVNGVDLGLFADQWLNSCSSPSWCSGADINQNGIVEGTDYSVQANNWLKSTVPGPISLWRLDETSGTSAYDSTGNGHNGTCSATDWSPAGGKYNGAALFDATTDFISVPTTGMNYNAVSISLWVNPTADTDNAWFFGHTSNPTDIATNRLQIKTSPGTPGVNPLRIATPNSAHLISGLPLMTPNTWFHIVLTLSGTSGAGTAICYVNGAQAGTGAYSGFTALAATAHIGNDDMGAPTHGAKAYIDDVRIYKKALSLSEVQAIYSGN